MVCDTASVERACAVNAHVTAVLKGGVSGVNLILTCRKATRGHGCDLLVAWMIQWMDSKGAHTALRSEVYPIWRWTGP